MSLDKSIYEYYRRKLLLKIVKEEGLIEESEELKLLKEIKKQTSDKKGILQNVAGNFIANASFSCSIIVKSLWLDANLQSKFFFIAL